MYIAIDKQKTYGYKIMNKNSKKYYNTIKHFVYFSLFCINAVVFSQQYQDLNQMRIEYEKSKINEQMQIQSQEQLNNPLNTGSPRVIDMIPYSLPYDVQETTHSHFAYNYFTLRDTVKFWENLPTPINYLLGPGDELIIILWGETQLRQSYVISREGKIYDEKVGLLNLSGKSIDEAREYLKAQFGRVYATLVNRKPTTYIDVSLGELKSINVNFVGQINFPGLYPIHPFSNLITGLIQIGGVDTLGSLRNIQIKRENKVVNTIDLYDYFIKGEISDAMQLKDQDVVLVPPRHSFIEVDSAIVRPGIYESVSGESVYDIVEYAGGPAYNASGMVGIHRMPTFESDKTNFSENIYIDYQKTKQILAGNSDKIILKRIFDYEKKVEILGQVKQPGTYLFYNNMTLLDLLTLSSGFEDSTFKKSVYINKAEIIRRNPNSRYDKVISVNLEKTLSQTGEKFFLENLDRVVVHANLNFFEKENVILTGEVKIPGSYPLVYDGESLQSFLDRAGGLSSKALNNGISIYRNNSNFESNISGTNEEHTLTNNFSQIPLFEDRSKNDKDKKDSSKNKIRVAWQDTDIAILPGDSIVIKEKTSTIFVTGAVYNPGVVEYRKGKSLNYYLNSAGGITEDGNRQGIIVLYPNGIVSPKKWYSSPKIFDGSTIIVNEKPDGDEFNITQFATNWTSIISSMITAVILSKQLGAN